MLRFYSYVFFCDFLKYIFQTQPGHTAQIAFLKNRP